MQIVIEGRVPVGQAAVVAKVSSTGKQQVRWANKEALETWRNAIRTKARRQGAEPAIGPIIVTIIFGLPRPKAHLHLRGGRYVVRPEYVDAWPDIHPDIDHLIRAVLDALSTVCYVDDKQVVSVHARKEYSSSTIIGVRGARRQDRSFSTDEWTQDALGLAEDQTSDIAEGQLHMSALQDAGS